MDHLRSGTVGRHDGQVVRAHDIADGHQQTPSEAAAGMQAREIDAREVAHPHERDGQRVAHGDLRRGRGRGREVQDAGLLLDSDVEVDVGILGQRRLGIARHGDEFVAVGVDERHDLEDLVGLARIGERHDDVVGRNHAQVAVESLAGMEEEARRAGRCERSRDLAPHETGFAHARDDALAAAGKNQFDRSGEFVAEGLLEMAQRLHLGTDGLAGHIENLFFGRIGHCFAQLSRISGSVRRPALRGRRDAACWDRRSWRGRDRGAPRRRNRRHRKPWPHGPWRARTRGCRPWCRWLHRDAARSGCSP